MSHGRRISVIGLGYVGLPAAVSFAKHGIPVVAYDINKNRVAELKRGADSTREIDDPDELRHPNLTFSDDPAMLRQADFHIVTVPTPITEAKRPDLRPLLSASRTVGQHLKKGDIVVYESTVYPGVTEQECGPVLEAESGLVCGTDFKLGYSPERINPGDKEHRFENIRKVVSGQDAETADIVAEVYGTAVKAGVYRASSIPVAEAAKVIENTQRDLNIAMMNELALLFNELGLDTTDVLEAAATKWNFLRFSPGLVGGHCIGVDPYYLTHCAERIGFHPQVILAGRRINDGVGHFVAREVVKNLMRTGLSSDTTPRVAILGVTFKENVPDIRNTRVIDIVTELRSFGIEARVHDPMANAHDVKEELGIDLVSEEALRDSDAVILAVAHRTLMDRGWDLPVSLLRNGRGVVADVKSVLRREETPDGVVLWRL